MRKIIIVILVVLILPSILLSGINIGIHPIYNIWLDNKDDFINRLFYFHDIDSFGGFGCFMSITYSFLDCLEAGIEGGYLPWYTLNYEDYSDSIIGFSTPIFFIVQYNFNQFKDSNFIPLIKFLIGASMQMSTRNFSSASGGYAGYQSHIGLNIGTLYKLSKYIFLDMSLYLIVNSRTRNMLPTKSYYNSFLIPSIGICFKF